MSAAIIHKVTDTHVTLSVTCPMCRTPRFIDVKHKDLTKWQNGTHIQDAFPELTPSQREMLITGYCDPCWDEIFPEEDEEDEEDE